MIGVLQVIIVLYVYHCLKAAQRQADITSNLSVNLSTNGVFRKPLDLFVDDVLHDTLQISSDLKGQQPQ